MLGSVPGAQAFLVVGGGLTILGSFLAAGSITLRREPTRADVIEALSLVTLGIGATCGLWTTTWETGWWIYALGLVSLALLIVVLFWAGESAREESRVTRLVRWIPEGGGLLAVRRNAHDDETGNDRSSEDK